MSHALLQWYAEIGVDEAIEDAAIDRTAKAPAVAEKSAVVLPIEAPPPPPANIEAKTLEELRAAIDTFPGFAPIKRMGAEMAFGEGNPQGGVMVVGDAPFTGETSQMLIKMLAAINLSPDTNAYLAPLLNWPGAEEAVSLPFARKHIELAAPKAIMLIGGAAAKMLLGTKEQVTRLRGQWLEYNGIPTMVMLHPEYLARVPAQKRVALDDLKMFQEKLKELGVL